MKIVKSILLNVLTGASFTIALLMVAVAYSDRLHPADHSFLACAGMVFPLFLIINLIMLMVWLLVKWRRAWIPIVAFVLSFPAIRVFLPLHFSSEAPKGSIKVVSYNVNCYSRDNAGNTIFEYIRKQDADIVCLQEDVSHKRDTTRYAEIYPYNDTVHVTRRPSKYVNVIGIHTRYPIVGKERIRYESIANGSVAFFLKIDDDTVMVINNHLESNHLSQDDRDRYDDMISGGMDRENVKKETKMLLGKVSKAMVKRSRQAEAVHHYIESHRRYPIIVCGDFNDTPISYVRRTIASGLTDCFVETGCGMGITFNQRGLSFRIDNIMCSSHFKPYGCYVDDEISVSDHNPVICWLERQ